MAQVIGGGVFNDDPYQEEVISLRAIGCNWLVWLACYLSFMANDVTSNVFSI